MRKLRFALIFWLGALAGGHFHYQPDWNRYWSACRAAASAASQAYSNSKPQLVAVAKGVMR